MKKNILVPIDFSKDSINALEHAIAIANKVDADIRMINVRKSKSIEIPAYFKDFNFIFGKSIEGYFDILIEKYKKKVKGNIDYRVREGKVYREVTNQAKYDDAYLIVMGTHGISGFEEYFIGSNAHKVVNYAPCPVITFRGDFTKKNYKKVVVPIDISKDSRKKMPLVAEFASHFKAEVHVVAVYETKANDIIEKLELYSSQACEYLCDKKVKCITNSLYGDNITDITIEYAKKIDADFIAILTDQAENAFNLWLGDYAQQMVNHSPIPVMTIRTEILEK